MTRESAEFRRCATSSACPDGPRREATTEATEATEAIEAIEATEATNGGDQRRGMYTINFTTRSTAEIVRKDLEARFVGTVFEVTVEMPVEPFGPSLALVGLLVRWCGGPTREQVEDVVSRYQGLEWNPHTGVLEEHEHMDVTGEGELRRIRYGVDYVFVDGPL